MPNDEYFEDGDLSVSAYPLTAVRVFRETVKENSFTKAARRLNVTQGAVSQRVKHLETCLGCLLFVRHKRAITLTKEGQMLYDEADKALAIIEKTLNHIISGSDSQRVVLGVLASFTSKWLIPRLDRFYQQHPTIQLTTRSVNHTIDVEREDAELAVVNISAPPESTTMRWQLLWRENLYVVCSPEYIKNAPPLKNPCDLINHTLLHDQTEIDNQRHLDWTSWLQSASPDIVMDYSQGRFFTQSDLTLQAAIEGHGIALARSSLVAEDLRKGVLIIPLNINVAVNSGCYICALKNTWDLPKIKILREWLQAEAAMDLEVNKEYYPAQE
ncbi:MAG: LysR substrate-binding domain-containing protein [Gammaproteobacteria bacterium WSBS_2016_MAG_OTU1]